MAALVIVERVWASHDISYVHVCTFFGTWHDSHMMWQRGACFYCFDVTFHMSISMLFLHDLHHDDVRWQQESLLLWLLLGEYGLTFFHTLHNDDGGWQQEALLRWLLLREYGH